MIPIVSIVGKSDSGKTTLIEKIIPELNRRGYKVATVKHDVHGFDIDREGKDSWRHKRAGAHTTIVSSPQRIAIVRDVERDLPLDELRGRFIRDVDIIITEGYKNDKHPKIEVYRKDTHEELLCSKKDILIAVVSDKAFDVGVPCVDIDDVKGTVNIIEDRFLKKKPKSSIILRVNGESITLKPFIKDMMIRSITGMISALKDCEDPEELEITISL
ncbi:MAG: molybdopterin-guanine dinucleotide biosynthesis protein B [Desulfobacterales bacterium]|nr:molybdopterin-guanine dinucleotide biosynthesis protein B [Desulfobacterales bacterium]